MHPVPPSGNFGTSIPKNGSGVGVTVGGTGVGTKVGVGTGVGSGVAVGGTGVGVAVGGTGVGVAVGGTGVGVAVGGTGVGVAVGLGMPTNTRSRFLLINPTSYLSVIAAAVPLRKNFISSPISPMSPGLITRLIYVFPSIRAGGD